MNPTLIRRASDVLVFRKICLDTKNKRACRQVGVKLLNGWTDSCSVTTKSLSRSRLKTFLQYFGMVYWTQASVARKGFVNFLLYFFLNSVNAKNFYSTGTHFLFPFLSLVCAVTITLPSTENVSLEELQAIRIKIAGLRAVSPTLYTFKDLSIISKFLCQKGFLVACPNALPQEIRRS